MQTPMLSQLHVHLSEAGEVGGSMMAPAMEAEGPLTEVPFANGHPDAIDVTEKADGSQLNLGGGTCLGHKGDDRGADGLGPGALGFPSIVASR